MKFYSILTALLLFATTSFGQCVVINEVMVNAAGACDGSCTPNTAEWIELYNNCPFAWNIECYILSDGDFSVTLPAGTTIPGNGFIVIGSSNSGVPVDVNIGTCGCTTGPNAQVGILTNTAEQLLLFDNIGTIIDGIVWGGGINKPLSQRILLEFAHSSRFQYSLFLHKFKRYPRKAATTDLPYSGAAMA